MHYQDVIEAAARRSAYGFRMRKARRRFKAERAAGAGAARVSFRAWALRTYNPDASTGKLARIVGSKDRS